MILVEHAVVVTMDAARRIFLDGSVLVDGERIVQVGRAVDVRPPEPVTRVIDGRGRLLLPGFVDTHVHLSEHLSRGLMPDEVPVDRYVPDWYVPLYATINPEEEAAAAQLACLEMLRTGTTTFCEAGTLFDLPAVAQAVDAIGLRAVLGRWTWDLARGPGRLAQSTDETLRLTEEALLDVKQCATARVSAWPLLIGFGTCSETLIRGAHALGERHGTGWGMMQFASHPSRKTADTLPLRALDDWGVLGPRTKLAHMVHVDEDDIALLARRDVKISHCPSAALKHVKGLFAHGRFAEMLEAGVTVSLGGDSANGSNHFDMLRLMSLAGLVPKDAHLDPAVMPPELVLEMATIHGARALGLGDEIGSLEPGKRADLVIFDLDLPEWRPLLDPVNTLVYSASGASVRTVMVDGRLLLEDRRVTMVDELEVLTRVERLARPYHGRAGLAARPKWPVIA
ncbi:MAG TPA: amidohydrolase family protein [Candidatus Eisenbacteria bacterium]|nr:amidohydrolase family protein [Candidatus Eisenbacteria bacterium]